MSRGESFEQSLRPFYYYYFEYSETFANYSEQTLMLTCKTTRSNKIGKHAEFLKAFRAASDPFRFDADQVPTPPKLAHVTTSYLDVSFLLFNANLRKSWMQLHFSFIPGATVQGFHWERNWCSQTRTLIFHTGQKLYLFPLEHFESQWTRGVPEPRGHLNVASHVMESSRGESKTFLSPTDYDTPFCIHQDWSETWSNATDVAPLWPFEFDIEVILQPLLDFNRSKSTRHVTTDDYELFLDRVVNGYIFMTLCLTVALDKMAKQYIVATLALHITKGSLYVVNSTLPSVFPVCEWLNPGSQPKKGNGNPPVVEIVPANTYQTWSYHVFHNHQKSITGVQHPTLPIEVVH